MNFFSSVNDKGKNCTFKDKYYDIPIGYRYSGHKIMTMIQIFYVVSSFYCSSAFLMPSKIKNKYFKKKQTKSIMIFLFRVRKLECVPSLCWMSKEVRETIREPKDMEKDMI